ncbi:MAG: phosphoribosylformylglycinamidine synthase subunit PurQ [Desulfobacteraceae bacterium]|jgi:phosphoribosylformylglycinamidine synthase
MTTVRALVMTGYGLNCDYETDFALRLAGADPQRVHINDLIELGNLDEFHIMVFGGGFSWADDHGAGVLLAAKLRNNIGDPMDRFVRQGKLVIGICNGFQSLVNLGLLPGFDQDYRERRVAITYNDSGNFIDTWVRLSVNTTSPCVFTKGLKNIDLPVRHGEGKFYAEQKDIQRLKTSGQVVMRYSKEDGHPAEGHWPENPNGSLEDIAGICDPTGRIFGLMPHPEAFHHITNHPDWTRRKASLSREGKGFHTDEGAGVQIFRNAVDYARQHLV